MIQYSKACFHEDLYKVEVTMAEGLYRCIICKKQIWWQELCYLCFERLPKVRVKVGGNSEPCSQAMRLVKRGKHTSVVAYPLGNIIVLYNKTPNDHIHTEPCMRCKDHPQTIIPDFYTGIM